MFRPVRLQSRAPFSLILFRASLVLHLLSRVIKGIGAFFWCRVGRKLLHWREILALIIFVFSIPAFSSEIETLIVPGLFNENRPNYWNAFRDQLDRAGLKSDLFTQISSNDIALNSERLCIDIAQRKQSLIIVAHSKGAAEAILCLARYPNLIKTGKVIEAIFIQGAFGSPLARFTLSMCSKLFPYDPSKGLFVNSSDQKPTLRDKCGEALQNYRGVRSLGHDEFDARMSEALEKLEPELLAQLSDHISYVVSYADSSTPTRFWELASKRYLDLVSGPNDGSVPTSRQTVMGLGKVRLRVVAEHTSLIEDTPLDPRSAGLRGSIVQLIRQIAVNSDATPVLSAETGRRLSAGQK